MLVVLALTRLGGGSQRDGVSADCRTPSLHLKSATVNRGGEVKLAVTGPANARYVVYLDVLSVRVDAGHRDVQTVGNVPVDQTQSLFFTNQLDGCLGQADTELRAEVGLGVHQLRLFRLAPNGATTELAARTLTVD